MGSWWVGVVVGKEPGVFPLAVAPRVKFWFLRFEALLFMKAFLLDAAITPLTTLPDDAAPDNGVD